MSESKKIENLEEADAAELRALIAKEREKTATAKDAFDKIVRHYLGEKGDPRGDSESSIAAMKEVSLAAIELAKAVVERAAP